VDTPVTLKNLITGDIINNFEANSVTWISVAHGENAVGFTEAVTGDLGDLGIRTMEIQ
jgi:hypothetical protein